MSPQSEFIAVLVACSRARQHARVADSIQQMGENFWNIRGSFKVAKILDVGTQMSLVRLNTGEFVMLDSYQPGHDVMSVVRELTNDGRSLTAIINLHPFHTMHVAGVAEAFPHARLFGTRRHVAREPSLRWESVHSEDHEMNALFEGDLHFTVPRGVELIPENESLHFSSVLAFHRLSKTLHVDDTLTFANLPLVGGLRFHPTLARTLEKRTGAVRDFRSWAGELIELCKGVENLCPAHLKKLPASRAQGGPIEERVMEALHKVEGVLAKHEAIYG